MQTWSEVGPPTSPVLLTPWTLNDSESPSRPMVVARVDRDAVTRPGTSSRGGTPTNAVPHDEPVTVHELAGTSQLGPLHGVQDTNHPPVPLATAVTEAGAPGPLRSS